MTGTKRIAELRIYEGEWLFQCRPECGGFLVEYAFSDHEKDAGHFLSNIGCHAEERCRRCGGLLEWGGFAGNMPITESFLSLMKSEHYMASTVILAAITELFLQCLVFAAFVDRGLSRDDANKLANLRLGRFEQIRICRSLLGWPIGDLSFPGRNSVAHGAGFEESDVRWRQEIVEQAAAIRKWVRKIVDAVGLPDRFMPNESQRWLLFMDHWSDWLTAHVSSGSGHRHLGHAGSTK